MYETQLPNGDKHEFELGCTCGLTQKGSAFCPRVYATNYTESLRQVAERIEKPHLHRCHTEERRDIYECLILNVASMEELQLLEKYIVLHFEYEKSNEVQENPSCVKRHSRVSQYWEAKSGRTLN